MPVTPNQMKAPDQSIDLETTRAISSIPKGGTDDQTWLYPSPQMVST
jgi:cytochrome c heme-lyase